MKNHKTCLLLATTKTASPHPSPHLFTITMPFYFHANEASMVSSGAPAAPPSNDPYQGGQPWYGHTPGAVPQGLSGQANRPPTSVFNATSQALFQYAPNVSSGVPPSHQMTQTGVSCGISNGANQGGTSVMSIALMERTTIALLVLPTIKVCLQNTCRSCKSFLFPSWQTSL